jgi:hypothetical protein
MDFKNLKEPLELFAPLPLISEFDCLKATVDATCERGIACDKGKL